MSNFKIYRTTLNQKWSERRRDLFIRKGINFKVRENLCKCNSNVETFLIEIQNLNSKSLINSDVVYKGPCADFKLRKTDFKEIVPKVSI